MHTIDNRWRGGGGINKYALWPSVEIIIHDISTCGGRWSWLKRKAKCQDFCLLFSNISRYCWRVITKKEEHQAMTLVCCWRVITNPPARVVAPFLPKLQDSKKKKEECVQKFCTMYRERRVFNILLLHGSMALSSPSSSDLLAPSAYDPRPRSRGQLDLGSIEPLTILVRPPSQ